MVLINQSAVGMGPIRYCACERHVGRELSSHNGGFFFLPIFVSVICQDWEECIPIHSNGMYYRIVSPVLVES